MTNAQERASLNTRGRGGGRSPVQTGRGRFPSQRLKAPPQQQNQSNHFNSTQNNTNTINNDDTAANQLNSTQLTTDSNIKIEDKHVFCVYISVRKLHENDPMNKEAIIEHILQSFQ
jgi:hypothetical protein